MSFKAVTELAKLKSWPYSKDKAKEIGFFDQMFIKFIVIMRWQYIFKHLIEKNVS